MFTTIDVLFIAQVSIENQNGFTLNKYIGKPIFYLPSPYLHGQWAQARREWAKDIITIFTKRPVDQEVTWNMNLTGSNSKM